MQTWQGHAGQMIGEYVLVEPLGAGGFGQVWKARHCHWPDRLVAVKIPRDERALEALGTEGRLHHDLDRLGCPNIVETLGLNLNAEPPYFITQYVEGRTLRELLRGAGRLSLDRTLRLCDQILNALAFAHARGVLHRDLKPSNVLIGDDGVVKLTDFGLGMALPQREDSLVFTDSARSGPSPRFAGTFEYMAPEQRQGARLDERADLYSFGVLLFEMLVGERPQPGDRPCALRPELPADLDRIFARCFTRRERRYAGAQHLRTELRCLPGAPREANLAALDALYLPKSDASPPCFDAGSDAASRRGALGDAATGLRPKTPAVADYGAAPAGDRGAFPRVRARPGARRAVAPPPLRYDAAARRRRDRLLAPSTRALLAGAEIPLAEFLTRHGHDPKALARRGTRDFQRGHFALALKSFAKVTELSPQSASALYNLGLTLARLGRFSPARRAYEQAIAINPRFAAAYTNLGVTLHELGDYERARRAAAQAVSLDPRSATALYNLIIPT